MAENEYGWTVYARRREIGGPWGFAYECYDPFDDEPFAAGWRKTQSQAKAAAERAVADAKENSEKQDG